MIRIGALLVLIFAALLAIAPKARAAESYDNCTGFITSVPAVINTQGTWCLKTDLATAMTSGAAITINTNNVTIDCNNFKLGGLAAGVATQANGVYSLDRSNITVRNCNIRGFLYGLLLNDGLNSTVGGHVVEDNRFNGNTFSAIVVIGDGSVIRRNLVFDTGGSTVVQQAYAIQANYSADVLDNTVSGVVGTGGTTGGISTANNAGGSISGNRIRGVVRGGTDFAYGIYNFFDSRLTMRNNDLIGDGSAGSLGLHCETATDHARDNVIVGYATGLDGCTDDGGNVVAP